ncbi:MAG: hypothetical protein RQ736_08305 [Thiogranum sp.]|nr:hypothetical protein [Thiogranum sp.]
MIKAIVLAVLSVMLLSGGAQCYFTASSDNDSSDEQKSGLVVIVRDGQLIDSPVQGVQYRSGSLFGVTGPEGEFQYEEGAVILFSIGDIRLGEAVPAKSLMSPFDLVPDGNIDSPAVINIARLLQSLDAMSGDARITIPGSSLVAARLDNSDIGPVIEQLDFADNAVFVNTATQLIASLTADYPHTAMLIDADTAREQLELSLDRFGIARP